MFLNIIYIINIKLLRFFPPPIFKILCLFYTYSTSRFGLAPFQVSNNYMQLWLPHWTALFQTLLLEIL